ncbi:hypothetical protein AKN90_06215 [Thiopseudomonas alkaliphila]|uniref:hypothetical protein n=1 Tax=Thiopseudomonas alkaliphila TaxID=1697053 RepID=UPI00069E3E30|nr:hypothetical protein [Thiopseudomonas alkaliphila]AKX55346.1 hypothetical protein AKN90_06215 [Thiopseudomonas alkaliphila]
MSFFSGIVSFVSNTVSTVVRGVGKALSKAKDVAVHAVGWLADKAENFIGSVKSTWGLVKPYIEKITSWVNKTAELIPWPWLRVSVKLIAKGLQSLLMLENSPILKKVESALQWAIEAAKKLRDTFLNKVEEEEAIRRQQDLNEAMSLMDTEQQKQSVRFAAIINDYILIQTRIQKILEQGVNDFQHYLRLRATQKLLRDAERTLQTAETIEEITQEDLFLMEIGQKLLAENPELTETEVNDLDEVIKRRFSGKSLLPFVFEEMISAWEIKRQNMESKWERLNKERSVITRKVGALNVKMKIEQLNTAEEAELAELRNDLETLTYRSDIQAEDNRALKSYVDAAEGFLQLLEKSPEQLVEEGLDFLEYEAEEAGMLIINCAQNNIKWKDLEEWQQIIITDYANIFAGASKQRHEALQKVEVM